MNLTKAKNTLLILGITALLSGALMKISHINYVVEILVSGLLLIGFAIILQISIDSRNSSKNTRRIANYPNIAQSFGITGIVILGMLLLTPLNTELKKVIGTEVSMLLYYLLSLLETYGGTTNLILAIAGSIIILLGCIYYLKKEFQFNDEKTDQNISESIVNYPEK